MHHCSYLVNVNDAIQIVIIIIIIMPITITINRWRKTHFMKIISKQHAQLVLLYLAMHSLESSVVVNTAE